MKNALNQIVALITSRWWVFIPTAMAFVWIVFRIWSNSKQLTSQQAEEISAQHGVLDLVPPTILNGLN